MSTKAKGPVEWRKVSMKQSVGKCKQINFSNLCVIQFICILESQVVECSMGSFYTQRF